MHTCVATLTIYNVLYRHYVCTYDKYMFATFLCLYVVTYV